MSIEKINERLLALVNELSDLRSAHASFGESSNQTVLELTKKAEHNFDKATTLAMSMAMLLRPDDEELQNQMKQMYLETVPPQECSESGTSANLEEQRPHLDLASSEISHNRDVGEELNKSSMEMQEGDVNIEPPIVVMYPIPFDDDPPQEDCPLNALRRSVRALIAKDKLKEAKNLCEDTICKLKELMGEKVDNVLISKVSVSLAEVCCAANQYGEAIEILSHILKIFKSSFGDDHLSVASVLTDLAICHMKKFGNSLEVIHYCEGCLDIYVNHFGVDKPETVKPLYNLGALFQNLGQYSLAAMYYEKVQKIHEASVGLEDTFAARVLNNVTHCLEKLRRVNH